MASAAAEAEKGSPVVVGLLVVGNIIILLSGLALFAETVWVTADQYRVYPLMGVSGKDDVFAGAWIAIFCGFSFFVVASFGVGAALCRRRSMILTGCFEHISHAIDSYTWGISWFGFAILMWTLPVMLMAMYFYTTL
ncbi:uroplakin-1a [Puma concolor]|uniref:Uroplakin-1a n=1 Tax=Puma concolor TaxID=9696 RepID=A0A6P6H4X5_PUMCO|nr:uroplakin-1a [Puma concolor]